MAEPLEIQTEPTPNPNSMKFSLNREVTSGRSQTFNSPDEALMSPLAQRLFQIEGVRTLFFLKEFISVGRTANADWDALIPRVEAAIRAHYEAQGSF